MLSTRIMYLLTAVVLGVAAIEPSSADSQRSASRELTRPLPGSAQDYWSASRLSLELAGQHRRENATTAACEELAKSLDYYRMALAKSGASSPSELSLGAGDGGDGMQDVRSRFGCTRAAARS
jgi:hypothetical protein